MISVDECLEILEAAIGETEAAIPEKILEATISYLKDYQQLKIEQSWIDCPERMGR